MRILSWNVNGIRACAGHGFFEVIDKYKPDVICLQEVKLSESINLVIPKYNTWVNRASKAGYSGTSISISTELTNTSVHKSDFDTEGRLIYTFVDDILIASVYAPNSQEHLARLDYKQVWYDRFTEFAEQVKCIPSIFVGDFNIARFPTDIWRNNVRPDEPGATPMERAMLEKLIRVGYTDVLSDLFKADFTYWSYRNRARPKDQGWRLDYCICSNIMRERITMAVTLKGVEGSDHCPILIEVK